MRYWTCPENLNLDELGMPADFDPSDVPGVFPPFERIVEADDGTAEAADSGGRISFDVFDENGELLGAVALPPGFGTFQIHAITGDGLVRPNLRQSYGRWASLPMPAATRS